MSLSLFSIARKNERAEEEPSALATEKAMVTHPEQQVSLGPHLKN
jgi:hypothetical protein